MKTLIEKYDVWRKKYHPMALMNEAMAEAAWIAAYEEAVQAEREACARVAKEWLGPTKDRELHIAATIRARSNT